MKDPSKLSKSDAWQPSVTSCNHTLVTGSDACTRTTYPRTLPQSKGIRPASPVRGIIVLYLFEVASRKSMLIIILLTLLLLLLPKLLKFNSEKSSSLSPPPLSVPYPSAAYLLHPQYPSLARKLSSSLQSCQPPIHTRTSSNQDLHRARSFSQHIMGKHQICFL